MTDPAQQPDKAMTGIPGLDDILVGGLARGHLYLLEGSPGTGKTTLALQFLIEGGKRGERSLYITLSETADELRLSAHSHGLELGPDIEVFELVPPESVLDPDQQQSLLYSSDLELVETTQAMFAEVDRVKPSRVVLDSLSEIRLLAQSSLRYRRQILALKHYFARQGATVLLLDDLTSDADDKTVHSVAHAVIRLEELMPQYGAERRRLRVIKYRGQAFRGGYHDFAIHTGGLAVFPRLVSREHRTDFVGRDVPTGNAELDALLGGGVSQGTSVLVIGPSGTGKSMFCLHFSLAAVRRGEKVAYFTFEEDVAMIRARANLLGAELGRWETEGNFIIEQVDAAELSPGEFAQRVRDRVYNGQVDTVVIDSLNGYHAAMPEENSLLLHLHELLQYLNRQGATTFLTVAQHGMVGDMQSPIDVTYLADTVILLRYFEAAGRVRRAISVLKKRTGKHEDSIREYKLSSDQILIGPPLMDFQGILRGVPNFLGGAEPGTRETSRRE